MGKEVVNCPKCGKEGHLRVYEEPDCDDIVGKIVHSIKKVTGLMGKVEEVPDDVCFITVDELFSMVFSMELSEEYKQRSSPYQTLLKWKEKQEYQKQDDDSIMNDELYFEKLNRERSEQINVFRVEETPKSYKPENHIFIGCIVKEKFSPDHTKGEKFRLSESEMEQMTDKLKEINEDE